MVAGSVGLSVIPGLSARLGAVNMGGAGFGLAMVAGAQRTAARAAAAPAARSVRRCMWISPGSRAGSVASGALQLFAAERRNPCCAGVAAAGYRAQSSDR